MLFAWSFKGLLGGSPVLLTAILSLLVTYLEDLEGLISTVLGWILGHFIFSSLGL